LSERVTGSLRLLFSQSAAFWAVVLGGAALRVAFLGEWSLDGDEWYTYEHACEIGDVPLEEIKPSIKAFPGIYLLTRLAMYVFGESETALRLFPCIIGIFAVPVFIALASRIIGRKASLFGGAFIACSPWMIMHSQMTRFYMGVFLFGMLSLFLVYKGLTEGDKKSMLWGCLSIVAAVLFHPSASILLVVFLAFSLSARLVVPSLRLSGLRGLNLVLLLVLAGLPVVALNFEAVKGTVLAVLSMKHAWSYSVLHLLFGIVSNLGIHVILLAALGMIILWTRNRAIAFYMIVALGLPVLVLAALAYIGKQTGQRYAIVVMPAAFFLAGYGASVLIDGLFSRSKTVFAFVLVVLFIPGFPSLASYFRDGNRHDMRAAADYVKERCADRDRIFAHTHAIFSHYFDLKKLPYIDDDVFKRRVFEIHEWRDDLLRSCSRVWVVVPEKRLEGSGFYPDDVKMFLKNRCRLKKVIYKQRFDYHSNVLKIYLCDMMSGQG